jgi:hypothetical protein
VGAVGVRLGTALVAPAGGGCWSSTDHLGGNVYLPGEWASGFTLGEQRVPLRAALFERVSRAMRIGSGSGEPGREDTRRPRIIMEGPLVSDTTDLLSDAGSASEDSPIGHSASASADGARRSSGRNGGDLSKLRVSDLQGLAQQLGISVTARMRKGDLVAAIQERQGAGHSAPASEKPRGKSATRVAPAGAGASRPLNQDAM